MASLNFQINPRIYADIPIAKNRHDAQLDQFQTGKNISAKISLAALMSSNLIILLF